MYEPLVKGPDLGIVGASDDSWHIESGTHGVSSAAGHAFATKGATIPIDRCHTHQGGNLTPIELPQLRYLGYQHSGRGVTYTAG